MLHRNTIFIFFIIACCLSATYAQNKIHLAPPDVPFKKVFFKKKTKVSLDFRLEGSQIFYTTDGSQPNKKSKRYRKPITVRKNTHIRARSMAAGFMPSETIEILCIKKKGKNFHITGTAPKAPYTSGGLKTLHDYEVGTASNFRENWIGFQHDTLDFMLHFPKKRKVSSINLSFLRQQAAWIFLPQEIQVLNDEGIVIENITESQTDSKSKDTNRTYTFSKAFKAQKIHLLVILPTALPKWHSGAGQKPWCFMDEIWLTK